MKMDEDEKLKIEHNSPDTGTKNQSLVCKGNTSGARKLWE